MIDAIEEDLGGRSVLSTGQCQLVRRVAGLCSECEKLEAEAALTGIFDCNVYGVLTDRVGRAMQRLGLERKPRDITPVGGYRDIDDYARRKAEERATDLASPSAAYPDEEG